MQYSKALATTVIATAFFVSGCRSNETGTVSNTSDTMDNGDIATPSPSVLEKHLCKTTGTYETERDCSAFAESLTGQKAGVDAFRPDQTMIRDQVSVVRYSLAILPDTIQGYEGNVVTAAEDQPQTADNGSVEGSSAPTRAEIKREIDATSNTVAERIVPDRQAGEVKTNQIRVGARMFACLSGDPSFKIEPPACTAFNMVENPDPVWTWQVTPLKAGPNFKLTLRTGIEVQTATGKSFQFGKYTTTREINVTVSPLGRFQDLVGQLTLWVQTPVGLITAITTLLAAIAALVAAGKKLMSRGKDEKTPGA